MNERIKPYIAALLTSLALTLLSPLIFPPKLGASFKGYGFPFRYIQMFFFDGITINYLPQGFIYNILTYFALTVIPFKIFFFFFKRSLPKR